MTVRDVLEMALTSIFQLQAYERLLQDCPHWAGKTVLMLVTSPSPTESLALGTKVSEMVDHINVSSSSTQPLISNA